MKFFIKRPTAIEQFRRKAGYPEDVDRAALEEELRVALDASSKEFYGRLDGRQVFRIEIPGRHTVYAVGQPKSSKDYDATIMSIQSEEEHRQNTRRELKRTRKAETAYLRYPGENGASVTDECAVAEIPQRIMELLRKGFKDTDIVVLKPVPWTLDITLQEFAS